MAMMVMDRNIIDALETRLAALGRAGAEARIDVRRDGNAFGDIAIFADWSPHEAAATAEALAGWPEIAEARPAKQKLSIRLTDDHVAARGAAVEDGALPLDGIAAPSHPVLVGFLGPNLSKIVGRRAGSLPDYNYSASMKEAGFVWDKDKLTRFMVKPDEVVSGNKMQPYGGVSAEDAAKVVAYLQAVGGQ